jgi:hypothetical protein
MSFPFMENIVDQPILSRSGYKPNEVVNSLQKSLQDASIHSTGKCLHLTADLVCSGGIDMLYKILWEYALLHVGIGSPRVFLYLQQRIKDVENILKSLPDDLAYSNETFQLRIGEIILVIRSAPTHSIIPWPKVSTETHDEGWLRGANIDPLTESAALRRTWKPEGDFSILRTAGAQISKAINDGSTERALFWVKWLLEEDVILRKNNRGPLTTIERGPQTAPSKQRTEVSYFILHLYSEIYKELVQKQLIRMNDEFRSLIDLWNNPPKGISATSKRQILAILTQILTEVPRWKVPAAPGLIKDPIQLSNAVKQVPTFFKEVLSYQKPKDSHKLEKAFKHRAASEKPTKKVTAALTQMEAFDKAFELYLK